MGGWGRHSPRGTFQLPGERKWAGIKYAQSATPAIPDCLVERFPGDQH